VDFSITEAADDLGGLARTITESVCTAEHQRELDGLGVGALPSQAGGPPARRAGGRFDRDLWAKLIEADILSTATPESLGGGGFGVLEQVAVLVALGRQLAAVPYLESAVLGAGALAKFGSESLQQEWATPAINGEKILAVALDGEMGQGPVQATTSSDGYRLTGSRTQVSYGPVADAFLVPAETDSGTKVFLIAKDDPGVTVSALDTTGHGSVAHLELQGVEAARVVGGDEAVAWLTTHGTLGRSAYQLGVLERALELTSEYAREREQFDRPIGSFQAVSSRLADGYIDVKGLRLTVTQAAWRLSEDLPADVEVSTAAFWAADAGHRVAHTTVHVHGGVGIDLDHPVHRYFLAAKQMEFAVGSATGQLLRIGRELADTPA
jgi:3-oxocholest-4-en-26-oyl-CoA dehydrogenase beta subunit